MNARQKAKLSTKLFRFGQVLMVWGIVCFFIALATTYWVVRPDVDYTAQSIDPLQTLVTKNYGIFKACKQSGSLHSPGETRGECGSLWQNLNFIDSNTARYIQAVMVIASILYVISLIVETIQILPIKNYRNFLAENRIVEMFAGIASVLVLKGMVIFAGEIRNKAERVSGQDEEQTGWSFIVGLLGLLMTVTALTLVTMFRHLPTPQEGLDGGSWLRSSRN